MERFFPLLGGPAPGPSSQSPREAKPGEAAFPAIATAQALARDLSSATLAGDMEMKS